MKPRTRQGRSSLSLRPQRVQLKPKTVALGNDAVATNGQQAQAVAPAVHVTIPSGGAGSFAFPQGLASPDASTPFRGRRTPTPTAASAGVSKRRSSSPVPPATARRDPSPTLPTAASTSAAAARSVRWTPRQTSPAATPSPGGDSQQQQQQAASSDRAHTQARSSGGATATGGGSTEYRRMRNLHPDVVAQMSSMFLKHQVRVDGHSNTQQSHHHCCHPRMLPSTRA